MTVMDKEAYASVDGYNDGFSGEKTNMYDIITSEIQFNERQEVR